MKSVAQINHNVPKVVIIGGGFGGLAAARVLAKAPVEITLIDKSNHHLFQPLLYQVATAGLSPADIAKPIRSILRGQKNVQVVMDEVVKIDKETKVVTGKDREYGYDYLIVAAGARHSYFGNDQWEKYAPGLKEIADATELRRRILSAFEVAEKTEDEAERQAAMTFVVVGAGPTGVEMAGAISELAHTVINKDFRHIDPRKTRVLLVEAGPRVLPMFAEVLSASAEKQLKNHRVEVLTGKAVQNVTDEGVTLAGEFVPARTVIWAAGNKATPLAAMLGEVDRPGRILVQPDLSIKDHPEIFAVGDMIALKDTKGKPVPGVSPAAMQAGRAAARNVMALLEKKPTTPFTYLDKGSMATIGRNAAVADMHVMKFGGIVAWAAWAFVHLFFLVGFRNRAAVFLTWAYAYFTFGRGARLITESGEYSRLKKGGEPEKKSELSGDAHSRLHEPEKKLAA
jgi:NADH dehydrogenase